MSEIKLVIIETDPETGMRVRDSPYDKHQVACEVSADQLARWALAEKQWSEAQTEMSVVFEKHGGKNYGGFGEEPSQSDGGSEP